MNLHSNRIKPLDKPTHTQRKSLGLGPPCPPRVRADGEATSIVVCAASAPRGYVPGDGESRHLSVSYASRSSGLQQPIRPGAMVALQLPSRGFRT